MSRGVGKGPPSFLQWYLLQPHMVEQCQSQESLDRFPCPGWLEPGTAAPSAGAEGQCQQDQGRCGRAQLRVRGLIRPKDQQNPPLLCCTGRAKLPCEGARRIFPAWKMKPTGRQRRRLCCERLWRGRSSSWTRRRGCGRRQNGAR